MTSGDGRLEANLREMERTREAYWRRHPSTAPLKLHWRAVTVRHCFHVLPGESVLELGAGSGLWSRHLAEALRGESPVTAVTFDEAFAGQADGPGVASVLVGDLDELPAASFDYVVGTAILCHDAHSENLRKIHRLLKPGGQLLFFEANFWNPQVLVKSLVPPIARLAGNAACQVGMRKNRLAAVLAAQGFKSIEVVPYDIVHPRTPRRLIPVIQETAFLVEHAPGLREVCGTLMVWAKKPGGAGRRAPIDLARHEHLRGSTSVVVPCRGEAANIPGLVRSLLGTYGSYIKEVIFVNDPSGDRTAEVTLALAREDTRVRLIQRTPPHGVGLALRDGYAAATGAYILSMDADFELIVPELRDLFDVVAAGADGAIGSRFSHESVLVNYPWAKVVVNRAFHLVARLFLRRRFRDVSNNLKLYRADLLKDLDITRPDFAANAETGLKPLLAGHDIREVPVSWIDREAAMGTSSFSILKYGPSYTRALLRLVAAGRR